MPAIYARGDIIHFDGRRWIVDSTWGIPGATQVVDLRDTADGRRCQEWTASILTDMLRCGW